MSVAASVVLTKVRNQLADNGVVQRWTDAELLGWLSDGQRTIAGADASTASVVVPLQLSAGTRQAIPPGGYAFLSMYRNMGTDGQTPGAATRLVRRDLLDTILPGWHSAPASPTVQNYVFNNEDPRSYYVYPPNDGTGYVEINYAQMPTELTSDTQNLALPDIYQTPLFDYVMARAHAKDSDAAAGLQYAQMYMQSFMAFVGSNAKDLSLENINATLAGFNPQTKAAEE
jgi:hypothetical protein